MSELTHLEYNGVVIQCWDEMLSLTDMWRAAAGSDEARQSGEWRSRRPADWLRSADAEKFIDALREVSKVGISHHELIQVVRDGGDVATRAHWQIGLAYAKYLSPEFHMWCNTVVRERMEGRLVSPEELEITAEGMRRLGGMQKAIVEKLLKEMVAPLLADMRAEIMSARDEALKIAGGHDPALHSVRNMRLMVEHLIDLKIDPKGRRVLSSRCSQKVIKYSILNGKRDLVDTNHSGKYLFHVTLLRAWMEFEGDVIIREWREKTLGQGVFQFDASKRKKPDAG